MAGIMAGLSRMFLECMEFIGFAGGVPEVLGIIEYFTFMEKPAYILAFWLEPLIATGLLLYGEHQRIAKDDKEVKELTDKAREAGIIGPNDQLPGMPGGPPNMFATFSTNEGRRTQENILAKSFPEERIKASVEACRSCKSKCVPAGNVTFPASNETVVCFTGCLNSRPIPESFLRRRVVQGDGPLVEVATNHTAGADQTQSINIAIPAHIAPRAFVTVTVTATPTSTTTTSVQARDEHPDRLPALQTDNVFIDAVPGHSGGFAGPGGIDIDHGHVEPRQISDLSLTSAIMPITFSTLTYAMPTTVSVAPYAGLPF
ncbi:hypothetical protein PFICI_14122 [Pestalotiopsis fici W106-1]|uniref:Uncharacterized protein n=1 Tax=Pestalotiopsis fici (strain W106-1 / CGMCC3.15140) TaxID=1229662 RepID=W3WN75_PESFW|nr:uncharacterized protein PFICI_14122 [Pestalotiopsis fici W106-1]ETS74256.1 hypothetical protein PFICI_14122 [Pestalotiopsis fici W106-1]